LIAHDPKFPRLKAFRRNNVFVVAMCFFDRPKLETFAFRFFEFPFSEFSKLSMTKSKFASRRVISRL